jgi:hypothetical protein
MKVRKGLAVIDGGALVAASVIAPTAHAVGNNLYGSTARLVFPTRLNHLPNAFL